VLDFAPGGGSVPEMPRTPSVDSGRSGEVWDSDTGWRAALPAERKSNERQSLMRSNEILNSDDDRQRENHRRRQQTSTGEKEFLTERAVLRIIARRGFAAGYLSSMGAHEHRRMNMGLSDVAGLCECDKCQRNQEALPQRPAFASCAHSSRIPAHRPRIPKPESS